MLNAQRMAQNIRRLAPILKKKRLITDEALRVLKNTASYVQTFPPDQWDLIIPPERSLEFVQAQSDDRLKPDIYCKIKVQSRDGWPISHLSLVLRVWSTKPDVSFRPNWDSVNLREKFNLAHSFRRVIFRCHYDSCNKGQYAPIFHVHFGGKPTENEYFWLPHYLELPRFVSPPMDLVLACEFVVAAFFPSTYMKLRQDSVWRSVIKESEQFLTRKYIGACKNYFDGQSETETMLDHLCSMRKRV